MAIKLQAASLMMAKDSATYELESFDSSYSTRLLRCSKGISCSAIIQGVMTFTTSVADHEFLRLSFARLNVWKSHECLSAG
jgi:hypothetical protein